MGTVVGKDTDIVFYVDDGSGNTASTTSNAADTAVNETTDITDAAYDDINVEDTVVSARNEDSEPEEMDEDDQYGDFWVSEESVIDVPEVITEYSKYYKVTTIAGNGSTMTTEGHGVLAGINWPYEIKYTASGDAYFTAYGSASIRKLSPSGHVSTFIDRSSPTTLFSCPRGLALDEKGNIYLADSGYSNIKKITPSGECSTIIVDPPFLMPYSVAVDSAGNLIVSDSNRHTIRKVFPNGTTITIAGNTKGYVDGHGTKARFDHPQGLTLDRHGNIIVADTGNNRIRKITPDGQVTTIPPGCPLGYFEQPYGVALDQYDNIYVADYGNDRIRKINAKTHKITTVAGRGVSTFGDKTDFLDRPTGLTVDPKTGQLIVCDCYNHRIRKIEFLFDSLGDTWPRSHISLPFECQTTLSELLCVLSYNSPVQYLPKEIIILLCRTVISSWPVD